MKIISNQIRTIQIEGIKFTPSPKGTVVPSSKVTELKGNFFFKHYVANGSFKVSEDKTPAQLKAEAKAEEQ